MRGIMEHLLFQATGQIVSIFMTETKKGEFEKSAQMWIVCPKDVWDDIKNKNKGTKQEISFSLFLR